MNIAQSMQFVDGNKHLCGVEARIFLVHDARVVQESSEVASRDVLHGKIDVLRVLECIQQANEPRRLRSCENVTFYENMTNLRLLSSGRHGRSTSKANAPHPS